MKCFKCVLCSVCNFVGRRMQRRLKRLRTKRTPPRLFAGPFRMLPLWNARRWPHSGFAFCAPLLLALVSLGWLQHGEHQCLWSTPACTPEGTLVPIPSSR